MKVRCDGNRPEARCTYRIEQGDSGSGAATFSGTDDPADHRIDASPPADVPFE